MTTEIGRMFNWLAREPERNYTLGESFQIHGLGHRPGETEDNYLNFTRAGRMAERTVTGASLLFTALIAINGGLSFGSATTAAEILCLYGAIGKTAGCLIGKGADKIVRKLDSLNL